MVLFSHSLFSFSQPLDGLLTCFRGTLTSAERLAYTKAVNCLLSKPANTPSSLAPGAKSRFDDFVAVHINQTMTIHYSGTFLSWHRYYTWLYEEALRTECGYTGTQPVCLLPLPETGAGRLTRGSIGTGV
jgi:hypothetical protein